MEVYFNRSLFLSRLRGVMIHVLSSRIILLRSCINLGRPVDLAILLKESPRIMEQAKQAKKVLTVITVAIKGADPFPTEAAHAVVKEPTL